MNHSFRMTLPVGITFLFVLMSWIGILIFLRGYFFLSFAVIMLAFLLDVLDGFVARRRNEVSEFGRQLDGHGDVFLYLVYPALVYVFYFHLSDVFSLTVISFFLLAGIFRLVRFNMVGFSVSDSEKSTLRYPGLPVFLNHIPILILYIYFENGWSFFSIMANSILLLNSFLMICKFPFPKPRSTVVIILLLVVCCTVFLGLHLYEY